MIKIAIHINFFNLSQPFDQAITQCLDARDLGVHLFFGDTESLTHTNDLMGR